MQIKMFQVLEFSKTYFDLKSKLFPIQVTYKLSRLFNAIKEHHMFYDQQLQMIIEDYAIRDAEGNVIQTPDNNGIKLKPEYIAIAEKRMNELLMLDVDVPDTVFKLSELEKLELTLEQFNLFLPFIEEEDKKEDGE